MMGKPPKPAVQPAPATPAPGQMGKRAGIVNRSMSMQELDNYRASTGQNNAMPRVIPKRPKPGKTVTTGTLGTALPNAKPAVASPVQTSSADKVDAAAAYQAFMAERGR